MTFSTKDIGAGRLYAALFSGFENAEISILDTGAGVFVRDYRVYYFSIYTKCGVRSHSTLTCPRPRWQSKPP